MTEPKAEPDPEVAAILAAWRIDQEYQHRSERTIAEREAFMLRYFEHTGVRPLELTVPSIKSFVTRAARPGQQTKPGTQWLYQQHFRAYSKWLVQTDQRLDNPMEKLPSIPKPGGDPKPISEDELARLIRAADGEVRVMVLLGAFAGLRVHEIAKVKGRDLDWKTWKLRVLGKRSKVNYLDLHPTLREAVAGYPKTSWWFPQRDEDGRALNVPLAPEDVSTAIRKSMRAAGIEATAHQLRHRYGTVLLEQSGNLRLVQELMRHESISSTQIYTGIASPARAAAIAALPVPSVED